MTLPEKLPEHWLNRPVKLAYGAPMVDRSGAIKFNYLTGTIVADYPQAVELKESDGDETLLPKATLHHIRTDNSVKVVGGTGKLIVGGR